MAPRWVIEHLLESVLPFIVMISYRAPTFQTLNFQEYCLDVRALFVKKTRAFWSDGLSTTESLWKATALNPSLGKTELEFFEKAATSLGFVVAGIQTIARQIFHWCELPEGHTELYPSRTWLTGLYLLKINRSRLSHVQFLLRKQETIWEGEEGVPERRSPIYKHTHLVWEP